MPHFPWWAWAVLAAAVGIAELHVPGSYLIWIASGIAITAAAEALFGLTFAQQIAVFAVASCASCVLGYFVYRGFPTKRVGADSTLNQRDLMVTGARGVVCVALRNGHGKVRLGDSVWLAEGPDLAEGTPVTIKSVRGTALIVEASPP
jgi:membrane protein implicated in regulation of membrane protease activity